MVAHVPIKPPDVRVVDADAVRQLGRPVLAVHREEALRLHRPVLRDRARVLGHAVQGRRHALVLDPLQKLPHPLPVRLGARHQPEDQGLVRLLALHERVPVEHGPHHRQAVTRCERVAREPEPHHVPHLVDVVRRHHHHLGRRILRASSCQGFPEKELAC